MADFFWGSDKKVRRVWHENEWWFVIEDVVLTFIDSGNVHDFVHHMRSLDPELDKWYISRASVLEVEEFGKCKEWCTNLEGIFRLVQSINLPKAEPFKLWLAKLGKLRVDDLKF